MADLEKKGTPAGNPAAADGKLSDEMQEKLKSLDKESNTVEYKGICGKIVAIICICFSLFQIYTGLFGTLDAMIDPALYSPVFRHLPCFPSLPYEKVLGQRRPVPSH